MSPEIEFTEIEIQLLQALQSGASNKRIARDLGKSDYTVRNQLSVIFRKIGVAKRKQAASWFSTQTAMAAAASASYASRWSQAITTRWQPAAHSGRRYPVAPQGFGLVQG